MYGFKGSCFSLADKIVWFTKSKALLKSIVKIRTVNFLMEKDSKSIEWKEKLSTDPLTAILASLDHFYGIYGASS